MYVYGEFKKPRYRERHFIYRLSMTESGWEILFAKLSKI